MRALFLIFLIAASPSQARELFGEDARTIVREGRVLASGMAGPPPWADGSQNSPNLYMLVSFDGDVFYCNVGASNLGANAELVCRKDTR